MDAQKIVKKSLSEDEWEAARGQIAIVELKTGQFVLGDDVVSAIQNAKRILYSDDRVAIRLGFDVVYALGSASAQPIQL